MIYDILLYLLFMMHKLIFKKMIYSLFKTYKKKKIKCIGISRFYDDDYELLIF